MKLGPLRRGLNLNYDVTALVLSRRLFLDGHAVAEQVTKRGLCVGIGVAFGVPGNGGNVLTNVASGGPADVIANFYPHFAAILKTRVGNGGLAEFDQNGQFFAVVPGRHHGYGFKVDPGRGRDVMWDADRPWVFSFTAVLFARLVARFT